ncbi:DUF3093 domain-containing protein [Williamsia deligens]|uniref:DUF3093 domain-containing protein n=1 Tax=Williamsia deligens TaxID=321325 RepID=A0ABW3G6V6_9NOCA|nr:DUF3093 domain-containing protein [Williamsia deligens]MCP2194444.1 hypothetical protein [Williamsia deligens]
MPETPGSDLPDDPDRDDPDRDDDEPAVTPAKSEDSLPSPSERGDVLFRESGGSWSVVLIGPILIGAVVAVEASGPGQIHWPVLSIFFVVLTAFSAIQVYAARQHVSVELTETTLRQGVRTIALSEIETIHPENQGGDAQKWESAPALGELSGVPRRRKGVGLTLTSGALVQAWARDHQRFRQELTEAVLAVQMGLAPRGRRDDRGSGR